ncbi:hypothetical protein ES703_58784 [subsurface metagenome]
MEKKKVVSAIDRLKEWQALLDYATEHSVELETSDRMVAIVYCLQRHWQNVKWLEVNNVFH